MEVFDNPFHIINGDETGIQINPKSAEVVEKLVQRAPLIVRVFQRHRSQY